MAGDGAPALSCSCRVGGWIRAGAASRRGKLCSCAAGRAMEEATMNRTIVAGDDPSWGVLQTYLPLYLEPDGSVRRELGGLHPLYEFLCEVAAMGTRKASGNKERIRSS